jgi:hypothetical protein
MKNPKLKTDQRASEETQLGEGIYFLYERWKNSDERINF